VDLSFLSDNSQVIVAFCAALAVFSAIVVVAWPYLARDELSTRMRQISSERERIRARERAKLEAQKKQASLRVEPKKFFKDIVDRFNLSKQAEDGQMVKMLRQAIAARTRSSCS
jgi:tight adherence protein C